MSLTCSVEPRGNEGPCRQGPSRLILQSNVFESFSELHVMSMFPSLSGGVLGPLVDAFRWVPISHLALMSAQPFDFLLKVAFDIYPAIGMLSSANIDLLYVVNRKPFSS